MTDKNKEEIIKALKELYTDFNLTIEYKLFGITIYKHTEQWTGND